MELTKEYLYENYIVKDRSQAQIAKELGTTESRIDYWTKKYGLQYKKSNPDRVFNLKHIDKKDPIFCYYAGLVATDGYLDYKNKRIAVRVNNQGSNEVLENLRAYFEFIRPIGHYKSSTGNISHELLIPNSCIFKELALMGIEGSKCDRTFSLDWFMSASNDCRKMFLRGISDGDGNFHYGAWRLSMGSKDFVLSLIDVFNMYSEDHYELKFSSNSSGRKYPAISLHKKDTASIFKWIYNGFEQYRFTDKYNSFVNQVVI